MEFHTLFVGQQRLHVKSLDSTNRFAWEYLAKTKPSEGTAIYADEQTAGKGQFGSTWQSPAGLNLYVSFIFYPRFLNAKDHFRLNQAVALALCEAVRSYGLEAQIKWPNDIYVGEQKLCGILIETSLQGAWLDQAVVGIGWNLNQTEFPPDLHRATSLRLLLGRELPLIQALASLSTFLEKRYLLLKSCQHSTLHQDYLQYLLGYTQPQRYLDTATQTEFIAQIKAVLPTGLLSLRSHEGQLRQVQPKAIQWLGPVPQT
jgi:BirA family biotin operon repressor/biotin-[acetyl-CoA-carboxylase] ligase